MKFKKNGDEYESLIKYLYQTLSEDSGIEVHQKYKIEGKSGTVHEIDVYYEFQKNEVIHRVIIECKAWNNAVPKEKVLSLKGILEDIPNSVGIIASKKGLQKGAEQYANFHGIKIVTGDKKDILKKILEYKLKILLPDQCTKAEPFWVIMEKNKKGDNSGTYVGFQDKIVLFISKKEAEETIRISEKANSFVVGVTKSHLYRLIEFSKLHGWKIAIKNLLMDTIVEISPEQLKDHFYNI